MAEMEYENPVFDHDDYDREEETSFQDAEEFQKSLNNEIKEIRGLSKDDVESHEKEITRKMIKRLYNRNDETIRNKKGFSITEDDYGRPMLYVKDGAGKEVALTYYHSNKPDAIATFLSFNTLQGKYGVNFVRNVLGVDDFQPSATRFKEGRAEFQRMLINRELNNIDIPLQEISTQQEGQELLETANNTETSVKEIETSFMNEETSAQRSLHSQTNMTKREMDGIIKAMTSVKEEIANELAKLNETNKDLVKENTKLEQAKADNDKFQIERISNRIRDLESERSARLEVININKEKLRSQVNRIKETIHKVLNEDKTLGERIKTLFREQGVTIASILTAFGLIIGVIVEAFSGGGSTSTPKNKDGVKDWIKKQLSNLGKLLANLAGKAAAALPGIIGSIVSWLLSITKDVVNWFGNNLWTLFILVVGLLYVAAKEYIS